METIMKLSIRDAGRVDGISAVLLSGEPGTGKTRWAKMLAQEWADTFVSYQVHEGTGKEELYTDMDLFGVISALSPHSKQQTENYISHGLLPLACEASQKGKTVLLLDELEKGRQAVDNMLLAFLQDAKIFVPHVGEFVANPANLIVVCTTNEQRMLSEPLYRRMRRHVLTFPSESEVFDIVKNIESDSCKEIGYDKVKFLINLAFWYRTQDVIKKITAPEIARLVGDLSVLEDTNERLNALFTWFSPHKSDWEILVKYNAGGVKYLKGMLK